MVRAKPKAQLGKKSGRGQEKENKQATLLCMLFKVNVSAYLLVIIFIISYHKMLNLEKFVKMLIKCV